MDTTVHHHHPDARTPRKNCGGKRPLLSARPPLLLQSDNAAVFFISHSPDGLRANAISLWDAMMTHAETVGRCDISVINVAQNQREGQAADGGVRPLKLSEAHDLHSRVKIPHFPSSSTSVVNVKPPKIVRTP